MLSGRKIIVISYIVITLIVCLEIYLTTIFFNSSYGHAGSKNYQEISITLFKYYGWLLLFLTVLLFFKNRFSFDFRKKISGRYILLHVVTLALFIMILHIMNPVSSLLPDITYFILERIEPLGIIFSDFTIKFSILFILVLSVLHYTLLLSVFHDEKIYKRYLLSILLIIAAVLFLKVVAYLSKGYLGHGISNLLVSGASNVVFFLLKNSGFNAHIFNSSGGPPILGTDVFSVRIYAPCSGLEGITTFILAFLGMALFNRDRMKWLNAVAVVFIGVFLMYVLNIVRIYVLLLIGHFCGAKYAVDLWHSQGSLFLYAIAITVMLSVSYKWMVAADDSK